MDEWDRKPKEATGVYISLKAQGESAKVRIAAAPLRFPTVWPSGEIKAKPLNDDVVANFTAGQWASIMRSPDYEIRETYVLLVIDRSDGAAKIFKVSSTIYGKIRDYAKNPEWGNPTGYDITVTRTETPGKAYWDVTPSPKSPITSNEVDRVRALNIEKLVPNALPTNVSQPDDIDENTPPEPLPWEKTLVHTPGNAATDILNLPPEPGKAKVQHNDPATGTDKVIDDIGDEPINLDDIPF